MCVYVGSIGPVLLDSKQLINYSEQAPFLLANLPSPPPLRLFISSVVVRTLQKNK